jgi:parallel beta-helix repeat protein
MYKQLLQKTPWLLWLLLVFPLFVMVKGCNQEQHTQNPVTPDSVQSSGLSLRIVPGTTDPALKAAAFTLEAVGMDAHNQLVGPTIGPVTILNPTFPLAIPLTLRIPPCRYRVTLTVGLTRDPARATNLFLDACQDSRIDVSLDTFEEFFVAENPIHAPDAVNAGDTILVSCGTTQISAPDIDRAPLSATLSEQDGQSVSGPIDANTSISRTFSDPFPVTSSSVKQRVFTCVITDNRAKTQTFEKIVARILPKLTPTPTPVPWNIIVDTNHPSANDANSCTTAALPCKTVGGGVMKAVAGDGVFVRAGNYTTEILPFAFPAANITLRGENKATTIMTASASINDFINVITSGVMITGLRFESCGLIVNTAVASATITNNSFWGGLSSSVDGVQVTNGASATISNNSFVIEAAYPIEVTGTGSATISGNTITSPGYIGIYVWSGGSANITSNTMTTLDSGIHVSGTGSSATISGNTIASTAPTAAYPVFVEGGSSAVIVNNILNSQSSALYVNYANTIVSNFAGNTLTAPAEAITCGGFVSPSTSITIGGGNSGPNGCSTCSGATILPSSTACTSW